MHITIRKTLRIFLLLTCPLPTLAQQYNGVNVNRIKGTRTKATKEREAYHQFSLGINLPRSMNLPGDGLWYRTSATHVPAQINVPGIQLAYTYNWGLVAVTARAMFEQFNIMYSPTATNGSGARSLLNQYTYSLGALYHWLSLGNLQMYSGATIGTALQRQNSNSGQNIPGEVRQGLGSVQLIAAGVNYKFSNFGIFGELGYGSKGLAYIGAFYRL